MKFLLLNQTFHPDVASTGQHLSELASELVKRGHAVTVVTGRQAYDDRQVTFAPRENWGGVEIHRGFRNLHLGVLRPAGHVAETRRGRGSDDAAVDFVHRRLAGAVVAVPILLLGDGFES
jgi:hypothetical protein